MRRAHRKARPSPHRSRGAYRWIAEVSVYIDEAWQGRRVGSSLYRVLIPLLREQGYVTLLAGITSGHAASERLHQGAGFVRCGTFHRAGWKMGAWHDVGYWELHLQPPSIAPSPIRPVRDVWAAFAAGRGAPGLAAAGRGDAGRGDAGRGAGGAEIGAGVLKRQTQA